MKLNVGDTVALNNHGLKTVFGSTLGLSHMKTLRMKVTEVGPISPDLQSVEVDDPEINQFLLYSACFDKVPHG